MKRKKSLGRKGISGVAWVIILIVLFLIIGTVLLAFFSELFYGLKEGGTYQECKSSCKWRDNIPGMQYLMGDACVSGYVVEIEPDDWSECDPAFEESEEVGMCAGQQFFKYIYKCWSMRGGGERDCGNLYCYNLIIESPRGDYSSEDAEFSRKDLKHIYYNANVTGADYKYKDRIDYEDVFFWSKGEKNWHRFFLAKGDSLKTFGPGKSYQIVFYDDEKTGELANLVEGPVQAFTFAFTNVDVLDYDEDGILVFPGVGVE